MTIQKRLARSNIAMLAIPLITAAALGVAIGELVYRPGHGGMGPSGGTPARQTDAALTMLRLSGKQKPPARPEVLFIFSLFHSGWVRITSSPSC